MAASSTGVGEGRRAAAAGAHVRRGHAALRLRQARPALRPEIVELTDAFAGERVSGLPRRARGRRLVRAICAPGGRRSRAPRSTPHGDRQGPRRRRHGVRLRRGGPRAARPHRQVPLRGRAGALVERTRRRAGDLSCSPPTSRRDAAGVLGALRGELIGGSRPSRPALVAAVGRRVPPLRARRRTGTADLRPQPVQPADRRHPGLLDTDPLA